jgi:phosphoglycolate phosphatase
VRLAILDFDGTLADSFAWFCGVLNGVADRYGFRRVEAHEVESLRGLSARAILRRLEVAPWKLPLIARHMRALAARDAAALTLFPGIPGMMARLHAGGIALAVVTSNREDTVRRVLGPALTGLVDRTACGAALFGKARKFRAVVRASRVAPAQVLCLGDEIRDAQAAAAAGLAFGAVAWGYTAPEALSLTRPAYLFETPETVAAALLSRQTVG